MGLCNISCCTLLLSHSPHVVKGCISHPHGIRDSGPWIFLQRGELRILGESFATLHALTLNIPFSRELCALHALATMNDDNMEDQMEAELLSEGTIIALTERLLDAIVERDWDTYQELVDPSVTCFEPEAVGHLVEGLGFHQFYFVNGSASTNTTAVPAQTTLVRPHVRILGSATAVISYVRLTQDAETMETKWCEETRVWHAGVDTTTNTQQLRNVHVHRSMN